MCSSDNITGSGTLVDVEFPMRNISRINAGNGFAIDISRGDSTSVHVQMDDNILSYVTVLQDGATAKFTLDRGRRGASCPRFTFPRRNSVRDDYLKEAHKVIPDAALLINVVSRRVKQLRRGSRALVESLEKLNPEDIALREIIEGKIHYDYAEE